VRTQADDRVAELLIHYFETAPERPTLRDQFAMAALTGLLASGNFGPNTSPKLAYEVANAMMKERGS
jgi:hypothetical protein